MTSSTDKVTRFDAELVDSAIAEGGRQNRTGRQQLEYWARIGRAMTAHETASLHRVQDALAGLRETSELTTAEGRLFDAEIDARLADGLARADYAGVLAARGVTTVLLDDEGRLVEQRPDGSRRVLDDE
ncbi:ParD-like family protein [Rhodococcus sp. CH91]|uniref:ParD-like family protein n=1 Tax=Rhodococcus sp. CH91 TaxID=2910256 RepID=UPI001F4B5673|nr:ParD-like family protein [Rhodococcus sp. CH91]